VYPVYLAWDLEEEEGALSPPREVDDDDDEEDEDETALACLLGSGDIWSGWGGRGTLPFSRKKRLVSPAQGHRRQLKRTDQVASRRKSVFPIQCEIPEVIRRSITSGGSSGGGKDRRQIHQWTSRWGGGSTPFYWRHRRPEEIPHQFETDPFSAGKHTRLPICSISILFVGHYSQREMSPKGRVQRGGESSYSVFRGCPYCANITGVSAGACYSRAHYRRPRVRFGPYLIAAGGGGGGTANVAAEASRRRRARARARSHGSAFEPCLRHRRRRRRRRRRGCLGR